MTEPDDDLIDRLAGLAPDSALARLRRERPDIVRHTEGAYRALLDPPGPGRLTPAERAGVALEVAERHADGPLAGHYRDCLAGRDGASLAGPRWQAIRRHVELMSDAPGRAEPSDIAALRAAGLSEAEIVTLAQLVAFVSYQARVLAGLRLMGGPHGR